MSRGESAQVLPPIIFVDDAHTFGGAQIALAWSIRAVLDHCTDRPVICVCPPPTRELVLRIAGVHRGLRFIDCPPALPLNIFAFPIRLFSFHRLLAPLVQQKGASWWFNLPDIEFCLAPLFILRLRGLRPVAWLHNSETSLFFRKKDSLPRRVLSKLRDGVANRYIFGRYRKIATPSHTTEDSLKGRLPRTNPPGTGFLYPISGTTSEQSQSGQGKYPTPSIDLWMISRVDYGHKNNLAGIEVVRYLQQKNRSSSLTVVGDGPDMEDFRSVVRGAGLVGTVHISEWEANPWRLVSPGAIILIPSFFESFCLVAREAMFRGIKMVLSPLPVFFEWIPAQLIARDFSTEAFAEKIEEVSAMSNESLLRIYAPVLEKLSDQAFVTKFLSMLDA